MEPLLPLRVQEKRECYCCDNNSYYNVVPYITIGLLFTLAITIIVVLYLCFKPVVLNGI